MHVQLNFTSKAKSVWYQIKDQNKENLCRMYEEPLPHVGGTSSVRIG